MTEDQIKHMVDRFLAWKLPENFRPDGGISFTATFNENSDWPMRHEPTGTNLFDANQAEAMVRHIVAEMPAPSATWMDRFTSHLRAKDYLAALKMLRAPAAS